jgi:hypothetical protein
VAAKGGLCEINSSGNSGHSYNFSLSLSLSLSSLTQVIRKFAKQLDEWLKVALHDLPENLRNIKFECKHWAWEETESEGNSSKLLHSRKSLIK